MYEFPDFKNLVQMASQRALDRGNATLATFITDNGNVDGMMSFRNLDEDARRIAVALVEKGLAGKKLMLLYTPGLDYVRAFFGCLYAGCVPVPAYPPVGSKDLVRLQKVALDCGAGGILSNSTLAPLIEAWVANLGQTVLNQTIKVPCIATDKLPVSISIAGFEPHQAEPDEVAFLQYTSGSTGHPKGVMVSHGNLLANFQQILHGFLNGNPMVDRLEELRAVIWLPPFHDMGLIGGVLAPIYSGAHVSLMAPLTFLKRPLLWLRTISEQRAHISGAPNFGYQYCARKVTEEQAETLDLSNWQLAFNGAEPIQVEALNSFAARFRVSGFNPKAFWPCYGLAEATLFVAGTPSGRGARLLKAHLDSLEKGRYLAADAHTKGKSAELVSSGVMAAGTEVKIVNPNTRLACAEGEVGEIWVRSNSVAQGYWDKPQFSASVFQATVAGEGSDKHYMRTGDLGFLWESELFVTGRIKEVVIIGGRNLYPQDIEQTLQEANPSFKQGGGAAFSVVQDGKEQLVIMQEVNRAAGKQADYRLLAATGARAVAARHGVVPMALILVASSSIPKTSSGKLQRGEARQIYKEGHFAPVYTWQPGSDGGRAIMSAATRSALDEINVDWQSELYADVQVWVAEKLDVEPHHVDLDVTFAELGVDSVEAVELVDRLQDRIERTIPAIELLRYPTVKALIDHFSQELAQRALDKVLREEADGAAQEKVLQE
ncbi:MAG TPA: AMP-binding protein [Dongiaceae bacterium]|nr:AMP-binding protein [Dongiaceae bacterium]